LKIFFLYFQTIPNKKKNNKFSGISSSVNISPTDHPADFIPYPSSQYCTSSQASVDLISNDYYSQSFEPSASCSDMHSENLFSTFSTPTPFVSPSPSSHNSPSPSPSSHNSPSPFSHHSFSPSSSQSSFNQSLENILLLGSEYEYSSFPCEDCKLYEDEKDFMEQKKYNDIVEDKKESINEEEKLGNEQDKERCESISPLFGLNSTLPLPSPSTLQLSGLSDPVKDKSTSTFNSSFNRPADIINPYIIPDWGHNSNINNNINNNIFLHQSTNSQPFNTPFSAYLIQRPFNNNNIINLGVPFLSVNSIVDNSINNCIINNFDKNINIISKLIDFGSTKIPSTTGIFEKKNPKYSKVFIKFYFYFFHFFYFILFFLLFYLIVLFKGNLEKTVWK
jgi:hypothetical protein